MTSFIVSGETSTLEFSKGVAGQGDGSGGLGGCWQLHFFKQVQSASRQSQDMDPPSLIPGPPMPSNEQLHLKS